MSGKLRYSKKSLKEALDIKSDEKVRQLVLSKDLAAPIKERPNGPCYWLAADVQAYLDSFAAKREPAQQ